MKKQMTLTRSRILQRSIKRVITKVLESEEAEGIEMSLLKSEWHIPNEKLRSKN